MSYTEDSADANNIRAAIYTRVSTTEQSENGYSIDEQEQLLTNYCNANGYIIYNCYSDRGISGKDIVHRPQLIELLKDAENKSFDMVLVWKINRISRKLADVLKIVDILERNNIKFKSYSEPFENTTPSGKMQMQMMALIGEFERNTIAENVKMGMCAKAKAGEWCGGRVLGYDLTPKNVQGRVKNVLTINPLEAEIVRFIFNEYAKGNGYKNITNKLNKIGYKTKKGNNFSVGSIRDILTNPVYIGKVRYNVRRNWNEKRRRNINPNPILVDGIHEAIIDDETWNRVQIILNSKKGKPPRIYDGEYPLTGLLKCPKCGAGMVIMRSVGKIRKDGTRRRVAYYCCGNWKNKGSAVCGSNSIRCDKANKYVFDKLSRLLNNDKLINDVVRKINKKRKSNVTPLKNKISQIDNLLKRNDAKKRKIFEAYEEDLITKEELSQRKQEINNESDMLMETKKEILEELQNDYGEEISAEFVRSVLMNFNTLLENCSSREEKKSLLHMLIKEITVDETKNIESINIKINDELLEYLKQDNQCEIKEIPYSDGLSKLGIENIRLNISL
ncbi:recombinase family protein [Clostridium sp. HCP1S3_B4]|uniref:recombinase family protein n=1 Tax=unclassified Clostridium TaxID=2614128 RepID=UPI003F8B3FDB